MRKHAERTLYASDGVVAGMLVTPVAYCVAALLWSTWITSVEYFAGEDQFVFYHMLLFMFAAIIAAGIVVLTLAMPFGMAAGWYFYAHAKRLHADVKRLHADVAPPGSAHSSHRGPDLPPA